LKEGKFCFLSFFYGYFHMDYALMHIGFPSLKNHVRQHIWFLNSLHLWISKLQKLCVSAHMVFKLFSLDFQAWKPMCIDIYGFQDLFNFGFLSLKTHVCQCIWFSSFFQL
jgi:hypothetical protein